MKNATSMTTNQCTEQCPQTSAQKIATATPEASDPVTEGDRGERAPTDDTYGRASDEWAEVQRFWNVIRRLAQT